MKDKKGEGYIFPCVMIVILCMIIAVITYFICMVSMVRMTKENAETVFDSYITENSIIIFDSIKQGNDNTETLDSSQYINDLCKYCTFVKRGSMLYNYDDNRKTKFYITTPQIRFVRENTLKIKVNYNMYIPMYLGRVRVRTAVVPIEIKSSLAEKF